MTTQSLAALALAAALIAAPTARSSRPRLDALFGQPRATAPPATRRRWLAVLAGLSLGGCVAVLAPDAVLLSPLVAFGAWFGARWVLNRPPDVPETDPLALAAAWDVLAACLSSGMPVPTAVRVVAERLPGSARTALAETAELLALGADPVAAWQPALAVPETARLARAARGTARSGSALAQLVRELATTLRATAADRAEALAQRAAVLVAAPLGLCFLPAFLCLGVVPVVAGLANGLLASW
ncbi:type II secretion system F family protein [Allokutzneria oryzae]|uniref:Type II secretion system F family protein n=1 Tax=Allokutzneria oryzae TaxID=1378989 RepID=A0ABV5ZZ93_9PSEU